MSKNDFPYNLGAPSLNLKLDPILEEISGITQVPSGQIAAVQDEIGIVFFLNPSTGEIESELEFGKNGDYEDIAYLDNQLYIVRSDGKIFHTPWQGGQVESFSTELEIENDVEGLCPIPDQGKLWLACKDRGGLNGKKTKGKRSVYSLDLKSRQIEKKPVVSIDLDELSGLAETKVQFAPSGIAINPLNGDIYLISSVGKILVVFDPKAQYIKHLQTLDYKHFPQPEGICFAPNGSMYISSEGGSRGRLMKFDFLR